MHLLHFFEVNTIKLVWLADIEIIMKLKLKLAR